MEALKWLFTLLWPPPHENEHQNRWQRHMALSMIVVATSVGIMALASTGKLESVGIEGFANRTDVAELRQSNNEIRAEIITQSLYQTVKEQCEARVSGSALAKSYTVQRLNHLLTDYFRVTGEQFRLPECEEI